MDVSTTLSPVPARGPRRDDRIEMEKRREKEEGSDQERRALEKR